MNQLRAILGGIIRRGMEGQAIRDALNERGSFASAGALDRFLHGYVHGKDIIAVYLEAGNTVGQRLLGQGVRLGLLPAWSLLGSRIGHLSK